MTDLGSSSDTLEEIDDPSELLSRPLEPVPLVKPPPQEPSHTSPQRKRLLPPGYGTSTANGSSSGSSRPAVWRPANASMPAASFSGTSSANDMIIGGSAPPSSFSKWNDRPVVDLTLDSDDEDEKKPAGINGGSSSTPIHVQDRKPHASAESSAGSSALMLPQGNGTTGNASSSKTALPVADDDDDEPVLVSLKTRTPEEFEIDHVKSNAIVCAGMINAVVLCMHGLPPSLTFDGTSGQEPPADPNFSRENWLGASRFWVEPGFRPVMLHLSNPSGLPPSNRSLPGGWSYTAMPAQKTEINVSVIIPPRARFPHLSPEDAKKEGPAVEPAFGMLAEKFVTSMEPLLRLNKVRCEARCRMVPTGRGQNFLHYLEVLLFARRPDLNLVSDRLSAYGIQLEHPLSYFPEDYPTEPQYQNPHNPPVGGMRNDAGMYSGIYRGAGVGTSVQNRELTEKEKKAQVDAIYSSIRSGEDLAAVEPVELISTKLLQHQKQALGFLLNRERDRRWPELLVEPAIEVDAEEDAGSVKNGSVKAEPSQSSRNGSGPSDSARKDVKGKGKAEKAVDEDSISLWKVRKGMNGKVRAWRNLITDRETMMQPRICRGAILADDMGLGKTITTLALIAHTRKEAKEFGLSKVERDAKVELTQAMQLASVSSAAVSREAERRNGVGKVHSRQAIRLHDSDDDEPMTDADAESDPDDSDSAPAMSLAVHGAPAAAKTSPAKGKGKKPKKDKIDPEALQRKHLERRSRATLIVCPLSVVSNWEEQCKEHWHRRKLPSIYIYHGPSRATNIKWIADHDIVLTTYSTLGSEFSHQTTWMTEDNRNDDEKKKAFGKAAARESHSPDDDDDDDDVFMVNGDGDPIEGTNGKSSTDKKGKKRRRKPAKEALNPLQRIEWFRIVLDEAHTIKGAGTWQSRATCNLSAQRRLCLTGTPIQNTINDLYALVKFLRLEPFMDRAMWNEFCGQRETYHLRSKGKDDEPIDSANVGHVQILMKFLALRRQKTTKTADGKMLLTLPPKLSKTEYLDFEEREKARYQALHDKYREDFEEMMAKDSVGNNYATILHEILNLRMTCDHPSLVDVSKDAKLRGMGADLSEAIRLDGLNRERAAILFDVFREGDMAFCSDCQADLTTSLDGDGSNRDAQELADALDIAAFDSRDGKGSRKRTKIEPGFGSGMTSGMISRDGLETAGGSAARPVVTRCQHLFCSTCFRRMIGFPWPDVSASDVGNCPSCQHSLQLALDAIELEPSDMVGLNGDQMERKADGDSDFIDDEVEAETKLKRRADEDSDLDEPADDFDWGSDDDIKPRTNKPKAPRKNGKSSGSVPRRPLGDLSLEGRKDLSTKIRALITDLLPFSKCNPHSALFDPTAPRLLHIDTKTSEDEQIRNLEEPVVVIQKPPPAVTSSGLLGKLDQSYEALESYDPVKSVVFSQWTKMLDRIQKSLSLTGIRYVRLDGTMKRSDRTAALETFRTDPCVEVLLVSLRAGGTGLNLVTACRAYLMDPYWNPAVENQGLDRIHRMGQTRPVITTKYIIRQSIEENMLRLQKRKMMLAEKVGNKRQIGDMVPASAQARRDERREELRILFGTSDGGVKL
uniref:Uncharacterized protein n=1 Tax=Kalmanozyma brasiliensis (strain GHG001) TaxID=1365824 RepID=V5GKM6_KALBG